MAADRTYSELIQKLRAAGLRPTQQRLALARLLFVGCDRHVTAEALHDQATADGARISLATVYNALHQFTAAGLLREIVVDGQRSYFDTNTSDHHHFFHEESGRLDDIPASELALSHIPEAPAGTQVRRVDVIVRVGSTTR